MQIHALSTGTVRVKDSFLHARTGVMRKPALFLPGSFSDELPIHVWVIEHDGERILVDTGESADVRDVPFARFLLQPEQELPGALATIDLGIDDIDTVVLTHLHGDHMDGAIHLGSKPLLVQDSELAHSRSASSRFFQLALRQPIPKGLCFEPISLDDGQFGAFARSRRLTPDGRVLALATPGHTPGHISVLALDDDGRHILMAGDATDNLAQLRARRADAVGPKPRVAVQTIDRILTHGRRHPTVYLPSHDPDAVERLKHRSVL